MRNPGDVEYRMVEYPTGFYKGFVKRGTTIKHGKGVEIKTGDGGWLFEGWFENGFRDGPGRYYWANGDMRVGEWKDLEHGKAKKYYKDGTVEDETWENGVKK